MYKENKLKYIIIKTKDQKIKQTNLTLKRMRIE